MDPVKKRLLAQQVMFAMVLDVAYQLAMVEVHQIKIIREARARNEQK